MLVFLIWNIIAGLDRNVDAEGRRYPGLLANFRLEVLSSSQRQQFLECAGQLKDTGFE